MNPDRQPLALDVQQVVWLPSSTEEIEVRVFGAWQGSTVPPAFELVVGDRRCRALPDAPDVAGPPHWSAAFLAPVEARSALEAGGVRLVAGDAAVTLPPAAPGALTADAEADTGGTLVDPAVLAERRARRAEQAEQSASQRAVSAEQTVDTLRTQLGLLEERLAGAASERDQLAARVGDAERRLRLAEQREEAERRRRTELEEETLAARREAEAELEELRGRLAGAEEATSAIEQELHHARRRQAEAQRAADADRAARGELEATLAEARARLDTLERAQGADPAEVEDLRARLSVFERERADVERLRLRLRAAEAARSEVDQLRRRLAEAEAGVAETTALRRRLADTEARAGRLQAQLAQAAASTTDPAREQALAAKVATLEAELAQRTSAQQRVQATITGVRDELARVRAQVASSHGDARLTAEVTALEERRRTLEEAIRRRDAELAEVRDALSRAGGAVASARAETEEHRAALAAARTTIGDLQARLEDERRHRTAAEAELARARADVGADRRAALEARVRELAGEVAAIRARLREATDELEAGLADERSRRITAEERLAQALAERRVPPQDAPEVGPDVDPQSAPDRAPDTGPDVVPEPDEGDDAAAMPSTGDEALDALIAGLHDQVASAREQLDTWDAERPEDVAGPAEEPQSLAAGRASRAADPPEPPAPPSGPVDVDEVTRRRLAAIEAELRAAVPDPSVPTPARDVIASLQLAAERLRTAAEEQLDALDEQDAPARAEPPVPVPVPVPVAVAPPRRPVAPPAERMPLGARPTDGRRERAWLRTGIDRLAVTDVGLAADLLVALLPAQALVAERLTYDLRCEATGTVRVALEEGLARVERAPDAAQAADASVAGSLAALAPLVAGGASWRLPGLDVDGSKMRIRRLAWARRHPVTLADLAKVTPPPDARLLLAALAAAVEPAWTAGERFAVAYDFARDGRWAVHAGDGAPLRVAAAGAPSDHVATVHAGPAALLALLSGTEQPAEQPATVEGDRRAADVLHAWFDRARGVAPAA